MYVEINEKNKNSSISLIRNIRLIIQNLLIKYNINMRRKYKLLKRTKLKIIKKTTVNQISIRNLAQLY